MIIVGLLFSLEPYVVTPHLNYLIDTAQVRGHDLFFMQNEQKIFLIIIKCSLLSIALID